MKRTIALLSLATFGLPLPLAAQSAAPELTLGQYQALDEQARTLYIAGLADMLDVAAAMAPRNTHLPVIAACTHGFAAADLRQAVEAGAPDIQMKWADTAPMAQWFVQTMILVCQLQLPPPEQ
jgi:hypothetical protein